MTEARMEPPGLGFLLLDASLKPIFANAHAVEVLAFPNDPPTIESLDGFLTEKIGTVLSKNGPSPGSPVAPILVSGRRHYLCRFFSLDSRSEESAPTATAVLIERSPRAFVDVAQVAAEFGLTRREMETVSHLLGGLTTKEIANRMEVSPNTVKAYIRYVMIKMNVSTRSGIIGKTVKTER